MRVTSFGDMASSFGLRQQTLATKLELQRLSAEATSGQAADLSRHLGGSFGQLAGIDSALARLTARQTLAGSLAVSAEAMQTALATVDTTASSYAAALLTASGSSQSTQLTAVLRNGESQFSAAVSALNTRFGGQTLFSGLATQSPALAKAGDILTALETEISGLTSASDVDAAVTAWFADPAGFDSVAYLGGDATTTLEVAAGESTDLGITARDPAVKATLKGLAMAALLGRGALAGSEVARASLAQGAAEALMGGQSDRTALAARLGTAEGVIEQARIRNSAEISALQITRVNLVEVDPYEAATRIEAAQDQLETIYSLTARMSSLHLTDFLR